MTKVFVLIYYLVTGMAASGTIATASVEFSSLGECERASAQIREHFSSTFVTFRHVCVEKTSVPVAR